jgi:transposase
MLHFYVNMSDKRLSIELRTEIAVQHEQNGLSYGQLALLYSLSKSSVYNICRKRHLFGTVKDRPRSGRPRVSSTRDDRRLIRMSLTHRKRTASELQRDWHVSACLSTVKSRLRNAGLRGHVAARKPFMQNRHRKLRLQWSKDRKNWTVAQWRSIRFVDECSFTLIPNSQRVYVHRRPGEKYRNDCITPSLKWRSPTLMVWGAIGVDGVGPLHRYVGTLNQHKYVEMLEQYRITFMTQFLYKTMHHAIQL